MRKKITQLINLYEKLNKARKLNGKFDSFNLLIDRYNIDGISEFNRILGAASDIYATAGLNALAEEVSSLKNEIESKEENIEKMISRQGNKVNEIEEDIKDLKKSILNEFREKEKVDIIEICLRRGVKHHKIIAQIKQYCEENGMQYVKNNFGAHLIAGVNRRDFLNQIKDSNYNNLKGGIAGSIIEVSSFSFLKCEIIRFGDYHVDLNNVKQLEKLLLKAEIA